MSDQKVSEIADLLLDILPLLGKKLISPSEAMKDSKLNPTQFFILLTQLSQLETVDSINML